MTGQASTGLRHAISVYCFWSAHLKEDVLRMNTGFRPNTSKKQILTEILQSIDSCMHLDQQAL
jgi:hypothetical protein